MHNYSCYKITYINELTIDYETIFIIDDSVKSALARLEEGWKFAHNDYEIVGLELLGEGFSR
jgi:hypothetical protein